MLIKFIKNFYITLHITSSSKNHETLMIIIILETLIIIILETLIYNRCINLLNDVNNQDMKDLLNYALTEAHRFKRSELIIELSKKLNSFK